MKQIINGKLYDTDKCETVRRLCTKEGQEIEILKTH